MLAKRIIPCLDVRDGKTVKGVKFVNLQEVGDPCELAARYAEEGADELVFLDITASHENRGPLYNVVTRVATNLTIPFTVGGGISSVEDVERLLEAGADKISVNSAAVNTPSLIDEIAGRFGSQCIVVAVDAKWTPAENKSVVWISGGRISTERETISWTKEAADRGAGEILLTSMDHDGTGNGFALDLTREVSRSVSIPVIASGGAAVPAHFVSVFRDGEADAALAAGMFHREEVSIRQVKETLRAENIEVRL